ncbi:MAG TPA: hypothetical protein VH598_13315 [Verrucomicrobiae bacterium]|nr:hypothetical protein [Verrucomicrobiae bacterium]
MKKTIMLLLVLGALILAGCRGLPLLPPPPLPFPPPLPGLPVPH